MKWDCRIIAAICHQKLWDPTKCQSMSRTSQNPTCTFCWTSYYRVSRPYSKCSLIHAGGQRTMFLGWLLAGMVRVEVGDVHHQDWFGPAFACLRSARSRILAAQLSDSVGCDLQTHNRSAKSIPCPRFATTPRFFGSPKRKRVISFPKWFSCFWFGRPLLYINCLKSS